MPLPNDTDRQAGKRIAYIDLAKGVCIILVVHLHTCGDSAFAHLLSYLRMPLYFFLSGLFFKDYSGFFEFAGRKALSLLVPFVFFYAVSYAIYSAVTATSGGAPEFSIADIAHGREYYNFPIWFLLALFWANVFFYLLRGGIRHPWALPAIIIAASVAMYFSPWADKASYLHACAAIIYLPFFYLGYSYRRTRLFDSAELSGRHRLLGWCLLAAGIAVAATETIFGPVAPAGLNLHAIAFYAATPCLIIGFMVACRQVGRIPFVSFLGRFSIIVLCTHTLVKSALERLMPLIAGPAAMAAIEPYARQIVFVATCISMLAVIPLCRKFLPYATAQRSIADLKALLRSAASRLCPRHGAR